MERTKAAFWVAYHHLLLWMSLISLSSLLMYKGTFIMESTAVFKGLLPHPYTPNTRATNAVSKRTIGRNVSRCNAFGCSEKRHSFVAANFGQPRMFSLCTDSILMVVFVLFFNDSFYKFIKHLKLVYWTGLQPMGCDWHMSDSALNSLLMMLPATYISKPGQSF